MRAGDLLTEVDLVAVAEAGYDPTTVLLITNTAQLTAVAPVANGEVRHGQPAVTVQV